MHHEIFKYSHGDLACEGLIARLANTIQPAPVVVICHAWGGRDAFAQEQAERVARMGYLGFAADIYGNHATATESAACAALMNPLMQDRALLRERLRATVAAAQRIPGADGKRIVVMGFCFGGLCALDCARAAFDGVVGVASFHGLFVAPNIAPQQPITARVLAMHGYDDPMATPDAMLGLAKELTAAGARWEIDAYGKTMHAFTNPQANDPAFGTQFDALANARSFARLESFLRECLA
ncbi:MAG: hypothetical protein EXS17_08270 [Phycisphaerales bacterium]|nr:hypothetical protein [Phycisphaerales bacterium]